MLTQKQIQDLKAKLANGQSIKLPYIYSSAFHSPDFHKDSQEVKHLIELGLLDHKLRKTKMGYKINSNRQKADEADQLLT